MNYATGKNGQTIKFVTEEELVRAFEVGEITEIDNPEKVVRCVNCQYAQYRADSNEWLCRKYGHMFIPTTPMGFCDEGREFNDFA